MGLDNFDILEELGQGAFGTVYKVKRKEDQLIYAMKRVYVKRLTDKEKENTLNEIRILSSI
jgi:NIMA (never in mitosis gene a)-related kinase